MGELQTVTIEHLDHEEAELEPVYLAKQDDPAIKQMGKKFAKVAPKEGGVFFAWVTDGVTSRGHGEHHATIPPGPRGHHRPAGPLDRRIIAPVSSGECDARPQG